MDQKFGINKWKGKSGMEKISLKLQKQNKNLEYWIAEMIEWIQVEFKKIHKG